MADGAEDRRDGGEPGAGEDAERAAGILERLQGRVAGLRAAVVRRCGGLRTWRVIVAIAGAAVIAVGAILLATPGPGWVVIFLGLGIWATEFAWASSLLGRVQRQVRKWTAWVARQPRWPVVATVVVLIAVAVGVVLA